MITDELCIELFYEGENMISLKHKPILFKKYDGLKEYLDKRFNDTNDASEVLFRIKNSMDEPPKCIICGRPTKYSKKEKKYNLYCSSKCQNSDPNKIAKTAKIKKEKYGDSNYNNYQKQKIILKIMQSLLRILQRKKKKQVIIL